ncbi:MAG TPA: hypothetical protein VNH11_35165 [Pirellulales bacterium]|nr:hypothetical protein [Pirellulales bacterium]
MQLQVLEYLIRRYADSPEAARPARCASTAAFYSNDRLIVIHHHLGRGKIAGVRNQAEANRRVGDILGHLRRVHEQDAEAVAALLSDLLSLPRSADEHSYERRALLDAMRTIAHRD